MNNWPLKQKIEEMNNLIRSIRTYSTPVFFSPPKQLVRFRQATTESSKPECQPNMDTEKARNPRSPHEKTGDAMSNSFGEGYATRCEDEGFGGIYGRNELEPKVGIDKEIPKDHPNHPGGSENCKTQGSEVKEKEKARFQTEASS